MTILPSLPDGYRAWVFGAGGGIGRAFVRRLAADPRCAAIHAGARRSIAGDGKIAPFAFDLTDEASVAAAVAEALSAGPPDLVLVATGLLHEPGLSPEKTIRALDPAALARSFSVNAIGPAMIAKHCAQHLSRERKSVLAALSARVGSIGDNRTGGWHSYRASKAALNMLIRNAAIEIAGRNRHAVCVALHPGTVDTAMSEPFKAGVPDGKLFSADTSAGHLLAVIDRLGPADSGGLFAWDGKPIPF